MWLVLVMLLAPHPQPTLRVLPRVGFAPLSVRVTALFRSTDTVQPGAWCLTVTSDDGADYERRSCEENLDRRQSVQQLYPDLPPGHYSAVIAVEYSDGVRKVAGEEFCVAGGDLSCSKEDQ